MHVMKIREIVRQVIYYKIYWEEIKSKLTHKCVSYYLITNSVHSILNKVIHYNTYDTLKWANERFCAGGVTYWEDGGVLNLSPNSSVQHNCPSQVTAGIVLSKEDSYKLD